MMVKKDLMIKSALRTGGYFGLKPGDRALLCLPVDFIAGKMMVVRAFVLGLDLHLVYPSSNPLEEIDAAYDFAAMTPMQVHHVLTGPDGTAKLNRIKTLIIGGGDMDEHLVRDVSRLSARIFQTYGMAETLTHVALKQIAGGHTDASYHALSGVSFDQDNRSCLVIRDEVLDIDELVTNDLVDLVSHSEFKFLGRMDHVINSGGVKIIPERVENKLMAGIPNRFVIAGLKDPVLGEKVVLIVEVRNSKKPIDLQSVIRKSALEKYERPREVFYVDFFPETSGGKVRRKKLLQQVLNENTAPEQERE